jgi:hypothetical protein
MPVSILLSLLFWQVAAGGVDVSVVDSAHHPLAGVRVDLKAGGDVVGSTQTDETGHAVFRELKPALYEADASKDGFLPVQTGRLEVPASVELRLAQAPAGLRIAPLIEFRTGFPYAVLDAAPNYFDMPWAQRFPDFFSVDSRFSKDFKVNPKYSLRLSVSAHNLTDHFNPEAFHNNIADPAYGLFFGQRGRHFTADFDVLF